MNTKIYLILILLVSILSGIYLGMILKENPFSDIKDLCSDNSDCSWKITNCCPENSGAKWDCVNIKNYKDLECPQAVICPQVISPKPTNDCICKNGRCEKE